MSKKAHRKSRRDSPAGTKAVSHVAMPLKHLDESFHTHVFRGRTVVNGFLRKAFGWVEQKWESELAREAEIGPDITRSKRLEAVFMSKRN